MFFELRTKPSSKTGSVSVELLHKSECKACPLNKLAGLKHPKMEPTGTDTPIVYMLGEAPGADEDASGVQFVGQSGRTLRSLIPEDWEDHLRWNNCVRTFPGYKMVEGKRVLATPSFVEIECCRPSVIRDIEATQPRAIFGFGNVPLHWATAHSGITNWRGRCVPVKIGDHRCWFFPMFHPSYVNRSANDVGGEGVRFVFERDLRIAFDLVEDLPEPVIHTKQEALAQIDCVQDDEDRVLEFIDRLYDAKIIGIDFETSDTRPYTKDARILTVALSAHFGTIAFPLHHSQATWNARELERIDRALQRLLYKAKGKKVVQHLAFELEWAAFFWREKIVRAGRWEDTLSQAYILDERQGCLSLGFLTQQHFGLDIKTLSRLNIRKLDKEPLADVLLYNAIDAKYHRLLYLEQARRLQEAKLTPIYREHLRRVLAIVLTQMCGVPVDQETVRELFERYSKQQEKVEARLAAMPEAEEFARRFGSTFRPSSNADVSKMVGKIIGAPTEKVDETALSKVNHKLTRAVLKWRGLNKMISVYIKPLMGGSPLLFPDGKLHPIISTTQTRTWRTSSDSPNIQNFPKHDSAQKEIRGQVRPLGNCKLVSVDYSQIQARNVAMESEDPALIKAFWDRYDIHADWMKRIARACPEWLKGQDLKDKDVRKAKRNNAKNGLVFPLFFGAGETTIAYHLGIPVELAGPLREDFWGMFPEVKRWHERTKKFYYRHGYVTGLTGFRRRAPIKINELINAPIQADEAAIVCDAMARLSEMGIQAALMVHDDLSFIIPEDEIDDQLRIIVPTMLETKFEWARIVPIGVEVSVGDDWASMKETGSYFSDQWTGKL